MTRFIVSIVFVEKVAILKFSLKLTYVFSINYQDCIWIHEINQFNLNQFLQYLV